MSGPALGMPADALPRWAGYIPPVAALAMFLLAVGLYATGDMPAYRGLLIGFGMYEKTTPFLDTHAVLSAVECHAMGIDVTRENPCDILHRPHVYGSAWLWLAPLGLTTAMTIPVGLALDFLFLTALFTLPRARAWRELPVVLLAFLSPSVALALERANNDIVVWLMALLAVALTLRGPLARAGALGIAFLGTLLKFYPVTMLVLLGRERPGRALGIGVAMLGALVALAWGDTAAPLRRFQYTAYLTDAFGAGNIAQSVLAGHAGAPWQGLAKLAITAGLGVYAVSLSARMTTRFRLLRQIRALPEFLAWLAMVGASLLIGCFFAGPSIAYRGIHLLLVLPAILALWRAAPDRASSLVFGGAAWVIVGCLWSEAAHNHLLETTRGIPELDSAQIVLLGAITGLRELAWWWLIALLMALAGCIGLASRAGAEICRRLRIQLPV